MIQKIRIEDKFAQIQEIRSPKILAELNGQQVKAVRFDGEFVWHNHEDEDELFLVWKGSLKIRLRDQEVLLQAGEMFVVPKGVEHCPVAEEECWILLFEPASTLNTGNIENELTQAELETI